MPSPFILRKLATELAMPCGIVWLSLVGVLVYSIKRMQRRTSLLLCAAIILYTALGNRWLSQRIAAQLESGFATIDPFAAGNFDAVFVLGGGVGSNPSGGAQLISAGDRVMLAARMFERGQIGNLIASGVRAEKTPVDVRDPTRLTAEIWKDLGVPKSKILLVEGRNTAEEMENIKDLLREHRWVRLGVITSATHMPRALRLADKAGLRLEPLPSNFEGGFEPWTELSLIPDAAAIYKNHKSLKEWLARVVGE
jgi:uncharacterized SAM-binding protein YcdF (DUF218 family)